MANILDSNPSRTRGGGASMQAEARALLPDFDPTNRHLYNRRTFMFPHGLSGHPLFTLPNLVALARRLDPQTSYRSTGKVGVADGWDAGRQAGSQVGTSLVDTLSNIASNDSLVMLKGVIHDPLVGPLLAGVLARIVDLVGPELRHDFISARATILIASPNRTTTYHADSDVNFLMQVAGDKQFSVFDQTDRSLVSESDIERFLGGDEKAIRFRPERQRDAVAHDLRAGFGVHVPCLAPHWALNRDQVSVAVSFNFDLRSVQRLADLYRFNRQLKRLGMHPRSPSRDGWRDRIKWRSAATISMAQGMLGSAGIRAAARNANVGHDEVNIHN